MLVEVEALQVRIFIIHVVTSGPTTGSTTSARQFDHRHAITNHHQQWWWWYWYWWWLLVKETILPVISITSTTLEYRLAELFVVRLRCLLSTKPYCIGSTRGFFNVAAIPDTGYGIMCTEYTVTTGNIDLSIFLYIIIKHSF